MKKLFFAILGMICLISLVIIGFAFNDIILVGISAALIIFLIVPSNPHSRFLYSRRKMASARLAGIAISIGGTASLMLKSMSADPIFSVLGSLIFPFGILMIGFLDLNLFTGKITDLTDTYKDKAETAVNLIYMLLSNLVMCILVGACVRELFINNSEFMKVAQTIADSRNQALTFRNIMLTFLSALGCGALVTTSICFSKKYTGTTKIILSIIPIFIFSICGLRHCIADPFFLAVSNAWSAESAIGLLITIVGNSIGGICMKILIDKGGN